MVNKTQASIYEQIGREEGLTKVYARTVPLRARLLGSGQEYRALLREALQHSHSVEDLVSWYRCRNWTVLERWLRPRLGRVVLTLIELGVGMDGSGQS